MADAGTPPAAEAALDAGAAGLRYVSGGEPGIRRIGDAPRFRYRDASGKAIADEATLERIRALAIPPAYREVWICAHPRGHLQATGIDARGRKQYRYHADWRRVRDGAKFSRMRQFGEELPRLRRRLRRDLALPGLPRDKVVAVVVSLLDETAARVGNAEYARANNSFGLTTLRNRHVRFVRAGRVRLRYRGKGGAEREIVVDDARLARIVRRCQQLPGQLLFQYLDDEGVQHPVDSGLVNDYLREAMGEAFTAKDFRTWAATVRAIALMGCTPLPQARSERALNACIVEVIRQVAAELGNTPAVCRKSYIHPAVFDAWRAGRLPKGAPNNPRRAPRKAERLALAFLRGLERRRRRSTV